MVSMRIALNVKEKSVRVISSGPLDSERYGLPCLACAVSVSLTFRVVNQTVHSKDPNIQDFPDMSAQEDLC